MKNKRFCCLELALQLREKGFDLLCDYIYTNHYRVKDEIIEQYPGLSDSGYYELTEKGGGRLKEEEIYANYVEPSRTYARNTPKYLDLYMNMVCTMPTLDEARTWLRDTYKFHVVVTPEADYYRALLILPNKFGFVGAGGTTVQVYNPELHPSHNKATVFATYEDALQNALAEALKYADKWNKV